jgi:hypothetical protein
MRDPTPDLLRLMDRLEQRLMWRPRPDLPLGKRLYRLFEGLLALKELEYLGHAQSGAVGERRDQLADVILKRQEQHYNLKAADHTIPERVRELRRALIQRLEKQELDPNEQIRVQSDMEDLFFVIQLFSYPSNYVRDQLTIERVAETLDKLEEDLLRKEIPSVRGTRRVVVRFGEPLMLPRERQKRDAVAELTSTLQQRVQHILDGLNAEYPSPALHAPL